MACGDDRVFPQNTIVIGPLDQWPAWSPTIQPFAPAPTPFVQPHTHYHFAPFAPAGMSDADVDRIAKRVAEILREAKP